MLRAAAVLALLAALAIPARAGEVLARLRPAVTLAATSATLGDVAVLTGDPALIATLAPLPVQALSGMAPMTVDATMVRMAVGAAAGKGQLTVTGACAISRRPRLVGVAELGAAAMARAAADLPGASGEVSVLRTSGALVVPDEGAPPTLVADALDNAKGGDVPFRVRVLHGDLELARALVTLRLARTRVQIVAARTIKRGEVIGAGDLRDEAIPITRQTGNLVFTTADLIGKAAHSEIQAGAPVNPALVSEVAEVRSGSAVTLRFVREGFALTAAGEALSDGQHGEVIRIRRADGVVVKAQVSGPGEALINF
jgi:flagella basal body P-ring formation protein FlgA